MDGKGTEMTDTSVARTAWREFTDLYFRPLLIVFLVLKLAGLVDWSWWWITSPLWGGFCVNLFGAFVIGFVAEMASQKGK